MQNKLSILIAEDDEYIALALHAIVKKSLDCHKVDVASDGQKAWDYLQKQSYDLILSDWNMPGLTGQELLEKARASEQHKKTPFLMLTARADKQSVLVAIQSGANDYISKPYQKEQLIEKLNKLLALSKAREESIDDLSKDNHLNGDSDSRDVINYVLKRFKDGKVELPVLPHVYNSVNEIMDGEDYSVDDIIKIIETEPAISAALITISNSSFYRGTAVNKTLDQAVTRIGLKATRHYIFMIEGRFLFKSEHKDFANIMHKLWDHSLATSICARELSIQLGKGDKDVIFSMGLLHDIGKLPLVNLLIELTDQGADITEETIYSVFATLHTEIGAIMLTQWHFPDEIINIVKYHHDITDTSKHTPELLIVHLANILVRTLGYSLKSHEGIVIDQIESAQLLNIDKTALEEVLSVVKENIESIKKQL